MEAVIVAVLSMVGTLAGSFFSNNKTTALITYRIQQLEEKVNKHNNLVERMAIVERDLKTAYTKIDDLKDDIHELNKD